MKVVRAQAHLGGQLVQRQARFTLFNGLASQQHQLVARMRLRQAIGLATLAGPIPRAGSLHRGVKKLDVLPFGRPGRARRSAVNAGGLHREHKLAIQLIVFGQYRGPARFIPHDNTSSLVRRPQYSRSMLAAHSASCFQIRIISSRDLAVHVLDAFLHLRTATLDQRGHVVQAQPGRRDGRQ